MNKLGIYKTVMEKTSEMLKQKLHLYDDLPQFDFPEGVSIEYIKNNM